MSGRASTQTAYFFFFQAEDGIRDGTVTGVQTCALPISDAGVPDRQHAGRPVDPGERRPGGLAAGGAERAYRPGRGLHRSEERRVGKEYRSRWTAYEYITPSTDSDK